jgi:hypothetical protein
MPSVFIMQTADRLVVRVTKTGVDVLLAGLVAMVTKTGVDVLIGGTQVQVTKTGVDVLLKP